MAFGLVTSAVATGAAAAGFGLGVAVGGGAALALFAATKAAQSGIGRGGTRSSLGLDPFRTSAGRPDDRPPPAGAP